MKGDGSYTLRLEAENCTVVWTDTFVRQHCAWKVVASQVTPALK